VTFDDLLVLPVDILRDNPSVLARYRQRFRFILVDEYQDTNHAQYEFVRLLAGEQGNLAVVGDDDQSIYGWRGADIRNILEFANDFPSATVVRLEENYRSTPEILAVANAAISVNAGRHQKTLRPTRPRGAPVTHVASLDERDEADFIIDEIAAHRSSRNGTLRDAAVLYRTNSQSRALEDALRRRGLPYRLVGAVRFYDRREIRDVMSYLKLIANPSDDEAFRRAVAVPRRGIGESTTELLSEQARAAHVSMLVACTRSDIVGGMRPAARTSLAEFSALIARFRERAASSDVDVLIHELVAESGFLAYLRGEGPEASERIDNVRELIAGAGESLPDDAGDPSLTPLDLFLQRATLVSPTDAHDPNAEAVTLMTMHNAKGLEFPIVFIAGMEDGLFPLNKAFDQPPLMEEERRLFYVGITRARERLVLTHAKSRRRNGETINSIPSSFLKAIPPALLESRLTIRLRGSGRVAFSDTAASRRPGLQVNVRRVPDPDIEISQDLPRFVKGERVKHPRFGSGTITELSGTGRETKVAVEFDDHSIGRKKLVVAYAGLERGLD
jgi:DNA helicase-2/ATP-dependent DNA helicase PcrA